LVCGGRTYEDKVTLNKVLEDILRHLEIDAIIHGAARGADHNAGIWAWEMGIPIEAYPAEWDKYGKRAGFIRNEKMLVEGHPDLVVAFPGGNGTAHMVSLAKKAGVEIIEVTPAYLESRSEHL
jgi:hypothetical protein